MINNFSGKVNIGSYENTELFVDFNDLFRYKGSRELFNLWERRIGGVCIFLGFFIILLPLFLLDRFQLNFILEHILHPPSLVYVLPFLGIYVILYGVYLRRIKDDFRDFLEDLNLLSALNKIKKHDVSKVEVENFFSESVLEIIDKSYYLNNFSFIKSFTHYILDKKEVNALWNRLGVSSKEFIVKFDKYSESVDGRFDKNFRNFFLISLSTGIRMGVEHIDEYVMFVGLLKTYWKESLFDLNISINEIDAFEKWVINERKKQLYIKRWRTYSKLKPVGSINRSFTSKATPILNSYGEDLTAKAVRGNFVISLGKENQMENILKFLQKDNSSSILLVGEPGVGKTHLLKHLATRMVVEDVPEFLNDHRIVSINLSKILVKSSTIENFKQVIDGLFKDVVNSGNVVLVIEGIGQIFSFRSEGRGEVISIISDLIENSGVKIIATTTRKELQTKIKTVNEFSSLFNVVEIPEPDESTSFQLLMDNVPKLENKYKVRVEFNAVKEIVKFGTSVDHEKSMPDKGFELLDEVVIIAKERNLNVVDSGLVDSVLKDRLGVNVGGISKSEASLLIKLESILHREIIGQERAVTAISSALKRARSGLLSGKRPVASFLFYGPTGVGKTQVARTLTKVYFGDSKLLTRLNMSEFQEQENLNKLLGYTDKDSNFIGGFLTEPIRENPYSLLLLDEIEKANPKVLDLFLQILDDGYIQDTLGREIDFTKSVIIATSNAGSKNIAEMVERGLLYQDIEKSVKDELRSVFRVEFLNRFDQVVMFSSLNKIEIEQIADIQMNELYDRLFKEKNIRIKWDKNTLTMLSELGYNAIYGARELRRTIQDTIENELANEIISGNLKSGQTAIFKNLKVYEILD